MVQFGEEVREHEWGHLAHEDVAEGVGGEQGGAHRLAHRVHDIGQGQNLEPVVAQRRVVGTFG